MCGIAGYFITNPEHVRASALHALARNLLVSIESRGKDATGYAYISVRDKFCKIAKAPVAATDFIKVPGHLLSQENVTRMPRAMLLHTRYATQGFPEDNKNNHPVYSKATGLCIIHNGWVLNDDEVIEKFKLKKDGEVDSETYLRLIEKFFLERKGEKSADSIEEAINMANQEIAGSVAAAMVQGGRASTLWVWRDYGDLCLIRTDFGYVFASTKSAVLNSLYAACSSLDCSHWKIIGTPPASLFRITVNNITQYQMDEISFGPHESDVYEVAYQGEKRYRRRTRSSDAYWDYDEWGGECAPRHIASCVCNVCKPNILNGGKPTNDPSGDTTIYPGYHYGSISQPQQRALPAVVGNGTGAKDKSASVEPDSSKQENAEDKTKGEGEGDGSERSTETTTTVAEETRRTLSDDNELWGDE